jgi:hypothetical protein
MNNLCADIDVVMQQEMRGACAHSISKVVSLFKQLNVDVVTRWANSANHGFRIGKME